MGTWQTVQDDFTVGGRVPQAIRLQTMSRRIDIELTSALGDGTWTWRAAGARQPRGTLDGAILPGGAKVGDEFKVEIEQELDGISVLSVVTGRDKHDPDLLALLPVDREFSAGRFAALGDRHAGIDAHPCSLDRLLELAERHEREGLGDAPWPPHYRKQAGEPARVQPSKRRTSSRPLIEIGRAQKKEDALAGLERWRARHPAAASHLKDADILIDAMRGRFQTWTRIRVNLQHVPDDLRPSQEPLDPDETAGAWGSPAGENGPRSRRPRSRSSG